MKQNEIARQNAVRELEYGYGWLSSDVEQMMNLFREHEKSDKEYTVLERVSKYPNHILGGWTWGRIMAGLLLKKSVMQQVEAFYKEDYPELKKELLRGEYESEKPIWVVIHTEQLEQDKVYPMITDYAGHKNCIVLAINES